ncbi:hypothetical protein OH77DRAFT_1515059 [Trametes cingulata]|nr:hypothetical protein OH77DRAFT_1515059 [Trametes cingulata]
MYEVPPPDDGEDANAQDSGNFLRPRERASNASRELPHGNAGDRSNSTSRENGEDDMDWEDDGDYEPPKESAEEEDDEFASAADVDDIDDIPVATSQPNKTKVCSLLVSCLYTPVHCVYVGEGPSSIVPESTAVWRSCPK